MLSRSLTSLTDREVVSVLDGAERGDSGGGTTREGAECHNRDTTVLGWVLAAPGVIPLVVGLLMIYGSSGSGGAPSSKGLAFLSLPLLLSCPPSTVTKLGQKPFRQE